MKTVFPHSSAGEIIDVIAPASACSVGRLSAGLELLHSWGYVPRVSGDLLGRPGIMANDDALRLQQFDAALRAKDSRLIWAVRGGYGCLRLLSGLDDLSFAGTQKILLGYSDITILQHVLMERLGWPMLYARMFNELTDEAAEGEHGRELRQLLTGKVKALCYDRLQPENTAARAAKLHLQAPLRGGNLTSLVSLSGTRWAGIAKPHILVLEEVGERGYEVDRLLTQLRLAGWFRHTCAIILGDFIGGEEPDGSSTVAGVLQQFAGMIALPVFSGMPVGHGERFRPLPLGISASLESDQGMGQLLMPLD
ncbi:MAG TPA: LD-carboxypeptidase [Gammaproteobacteria bacterium]|nr:LD-carboxypeptidase [Gammaproteobacteria bacterium]